MKYNFKVTKRVTPAKAELVLLETKVHADQTLSQWYVFRYYLYYLLIERRSYGNREELIFEISNNGMIWHGTLNVPNPITEKELRRICFKFIRSYHDEKVFG